jgi:hypothetical protein
MPNYKWIADQAHPGGYLVELTPEEEAQLQSDWAAWAIIAAADATAAENATQMRDDVVSRLAALIEAADKIASDQATPAEQRDALALNLRTTARLARLVLRRLDVAV